MTDFTKLARLAVTIVIAAALGACGKSSTSPVAPSKATAAPGAIQAPVPTPTSGGASIDGTVMGVSGAQRLTSRPQTSGPSVTVAGTTVSSSIDATGHFSLQGVPAGNIVLQITATGVNASLSIAGVSDLEQIHVTIQISGSTATETDSDSETPDNRAEVEGRITAISGDTITVAGKVITVPSTTPIQHGGTPVAFSALQVGERVHVQGTRSGTGVTATSIELQTANPGNPGPVTPPPGGGDTGNGPGDGQGDNGDNPGNDQGSGVNLSGTIAGLAGACPALTFSVSSTKVATSAATQFKGVQCSALANGTRVEVKGTKQTDGSVLASRVQPGK